MSERRIYKYEFAVGDVVEISLPLGAKILHVDSQGSATRGCLWALVDPEVKSMVCRFCVIGTGHPVSDWENLTHVGTWLAGPFVWHMFEMKS